MIRRLMDLLTAREVARATETLQLDLAELRDHRAVLAAQLVTARQTIDTLRAAAAPAPAEVELGPDAGWDNFVKASA